MTYTTSEVQINTGNNSAALSLKSNQLKEKIKQGKQTLGTWVQSGSGVYAEMAACAGFDFLIIDQEHGPGELQTAIDMVRAAAFSNTTAVIRTPGSDTNYIRRLVEAGIEALLIPMVETAEQAKVIVDACRFPPLGHRGDAAHVTRSSYYGFVKDYHKQAADKIMIMVQIETQLGAQNAQEICQVDGVDMVFIGPSDLAGSVGLLGQTGAPKVSEMIADVVSIAKKYNMPLGTVPRENRNVPQLFADGFSLVAIGSDIACYHDFLCSLINEYKR